MTVREDVVVLISDQDVAFDSIWKPVLSAAYNCGICFERLKFNGENFYSLPMCVSGTPEREKMIDGSLTKAEIINLLGPQGGGGVVLNPLHPEGSGGIVVNFTHAFEKCHTFQVKEEISAQKNDFEVADYFKRGYNNMLGKVRCHLYVNDDDLTFNRGYNNML